MTVYLINLSFGLAGIERRFANIWQALRRRGNVRPILVVPDTLAIQLARAGLAAPDDEMLWSVRESSWMRSASHVPLPATARVARNYLRSRLMARSFRAVWERIARDAGAVVHIGLNCSALTPPELPLVYECVDSTLTQLDSRHYRLAATRPCIVHCQTDRIRDALERTMAARTPRWTTVTSPCYFASYTDAPAAQDPRLIAFVGRLAAEKNPVLFVDAIALLRDRGVACRALILGHGPLREAVQRRVAELSLGGLVEIEFTERPIERLRQASIYVTLQSGDNYGSQSLLEAMGAGCAIVASDVGETWKLVRDDTGVRVPFDARALAGALEALLGNPARTRMLGAAAANLARIHHSADRYVMFLEQLYQQAVEVSQHGRVFDGRYSQWRMIN